MQSYLRYYSLWFDIVCDHMWHILSKGHERVPVLWLTMDSSFLCHWWFRTPLHIFEKSTEKMNGNFSSRSILTHFVLHNKLCAAPLSSAWSFSLFFSAVQSSSWCEWSMSLIFAVALVLLLKPEHPLVVRLGRPSWYRSTVKCTGGPGYTATGLWSC